MKKHISKLLIILMLAVLFVPLFSNLALANTYDSNYILLKEFADLRYPQIGTTQADGPIYRITTYNYGGIQVAYIMGTRSDITGYISVPYATNRQIIKETYQDDTNNDFGGYSEVIFGEGVFTGATNSGTDIIIELMMTKQDWHDNKYPSDPPDITSRPILDLPFYIMYSDPDYSFINLQSYENLPVFTFGDYSDIDNMEFDVNWYGFGNMKRYIFQDEEWHLSETKVEGEYWNDTGLDRKIIMECNHSILDYTGETSLEPINYSSGEPPKILGGSFDQQGYGVKFILPRNGFKDNSFIWSYQTWFRLPYDDIEGDKYIIDTVELGFGGDYKEGTKQVHFSNMEVKTIDGRKVIEGNYTVSVGHEIGVNEVTFQAKRNNDEKYWSATLQTERLSGFVDEDGDGLDDRTGRDDNNDENPWHYDDYNPDGQRPDRGQYGEDIIGTVSYYADTLLYWLLSPFRLIADGLKSALDIVTDTFGWAGNFANMIGGLFSFLPPEITGMITLAFTSLIVFTIIKVVRK